MAVSSSLPNRPCSPACGLRPATAILGRGYPNLGSSAAVSRMVAAIESAVSRLRHVGQRKMDGRQHHPQRIGVEHHRDGPRAGQVREQIRVPVPRQAGEPERLLVDRRRGNRLDLATLRGVGRAHDRCRMRRGPLRRSARPGQTPGPAAARRGSARRRRGRAGRRRRRRGDFRTDAGGSPTVIAIRGRLMLNDCRSRSHPIRTSRRRCHSPTGCRTRLRSRSRRARHLWRSAARNAGST